MHKFSEEVDFSDAKHQMSVTDELRVFNSYFYQVNQAPPNNLGKMTDFIDIWQEKVTDNTLPGWSDFSFENFKGWHSNMRLIKCGEIHNKADEVMIVGEGFAQLWGRFSLSEQIRNGEITSKSLVANFQEYLGYVYNMHYVISAGVIPIQAYSRQSIMFVDLPLSNENNEVSHIVSAILPTKKC